MLSIYCRPNFHLESTKIKLLIWLFSALGAAGGLLSGVSYLLGKDLLQDQEKLRL